MPIFSVSISMICRSKGRQVCASAAYQAREKIFDIRQNLTFAYQNRDGEELLATQIMMPAGAPAWDRSKLWNECEKVERRKDSQTARSIRLALPRELNIEQMLELVRSFLNEQFLSRGLACDFAVHDKMAADGGGQPHVHVLVLTRAISAQGWAKKKDRKTLCSGRDVRRFRSDWAVAVNTTLSAAGIEAAIDHRSLSEQRREVKEFLQSDSLDTDTRNILQVALHERSRAAEGKARPRAWRAARRAGELPAEVQSIRDLRYTAFIEAEELRCLLESRQRLIVEMGANLTSQLTDESDQASNEGAPQQDMEMSEGIEFDDPNIEFMDNPPGFRPS
jgi:hypothetical protein